VSTAEVDLTGEGRRRYLPWRQGMSRAIGFEFAGALSVASGPDTAMVRAQHVMNGQLLLGVLEPGRN
jgi:hypothetical protein